MASDAAALAAQLAVLATPSSPQPSVVQGQVVSWQSGATPPTVTINLSGDTQDIPGIQYLDSYTPTPGDIVQIIKQDGSLLVVGTIATAYISPSPLGISQGGTGQSTRQAAINALAGSVSSGTYLRGNGTNDVMSAIQVADVPGVNGVTVSGTPSSGEVLTATSGSAANWQTPSGPSTTPVNPGYTSNGVNVTSNNTVCSVTVAVPSGTHVRVTATWGIVTTSGTAAGNDGEILVYRDGGSTTLGLPTLVTPYANGPISGGSFVCYDYAAGGSTHTFAWAIQDQGAGSFTVSNGAIAVETVY